jgi:hypothetical protein
MDKILYISNFQNDPIRKCFEDAFHAMMQYQKILPSFFIPESWDNRDDMKQWTKNLEMAAAFLSIDGLIYSPDEVMTMIKKTANPTKTLIEIRFSIFKKLLDILKGEYDTDIHMFELTDTRIELSVNKRAGKFEASVFTSGNHSYGEQVMTLTNLSFGIIMTNLEIDPSRFKRCESMKCRMIFYEGKPGKRDKMSKKYCSTNCGQNERNRLKGLNHEYEKMKT